ncbi:hypothetical protein ARMSODRAFT_1004629 [Armillaria solidipes]|uniref:Uncharacterized protein n=1 Tax=Armillaria solidipes TaxID=1076256 RepID=A0A2H3BD51_9AGAR|nr:hypothetical protein ARMSODRAFT_1004629 [Armillaria solidipes]
MHDASPAVAWQCPCHASFPSYLNILFITKGLPERRPGTPGRTTDLDNEADIDATDTANDRPDNVNDDTTEEDKPSGGDDYRLSKENRPYDEETASPPATLPSHTSSTLDTADSAIRTSPPPADASIPSNSGGPATAALGDTDVGLILRRSGREKCRVVDIDA